MGKLRSVSGPVLTEAAIGVLDDPDAQTAMDALIYLTAYGSKDVEAPVWARYERWSQEWAGKGDELERREVGSFGSNSEQRGLGENLAAALLRNQGWLADDKLIARVQERCVGEQMCADVRQMAAAARAPYQVMASAQGSTNVYNVGQYSCRSKKLFEEKVAQFPKGSVFLIGDNKLAARKEQRDLNDQTREILTKNGMVVRTQ